MNIFLIYLAVNTPQNRGYNYGLGYVAGVLKEAGHNITYITLKTKKDITILYERIKSENPKIIGFSTTSCQFRFVKEISKDIRAISDAFIISGGIHATIRPECILEVPELDAIVRGEGESPMLEFISALEKNKDYFNIKNFWFKKGNKIIKNKIRPLITKLDDLPFPHKSSLDYQKVIRNAQGANNFIFSRGCPFECTYCSNKAISEVYPNRHKYFRVRSPQKAIEEIERDRERYKFNSVVFDDDTISLNKEWFYEFFKLYKQKFNYPFKCNLRIGTIDSDMMALLKEAGVKEILVGVEHGNEEFRKNVLKRNMTNKQINDFIDLCKQYNIKYKAFLMVGFPYETKKLFLDTIKLSRQISVKSRAYIFQPYPGTELGKICEKNNWLPEREEFREREEAVISYPGFSKRQVQLCSDASYPLTKFKFIPLNLPLEFTAYPFKLLNSIRVKLLSFTQKNV